MMRWLVTIASITGTALFVSYQWYGCATFFGLLALDCIVNYKVED